MSTDGGYSDHRAVSPHETDVNTAEHVQHIGELIADAQAINDNWSNAAYRKNQVKDM